MHNHTYLQRDEDTDKETDMQKKTGKPRMSEHEHTIRPSSENKLE